MLTPVKRKSHEITSFEVKNKSAFFSSESGVLRVEILKKDTVRVSFSDTGSFDKEQDDYLKTYDKEDIKVSESEGHFIIEHERISAEVIKNNGAVFVYKDGNLYYRESVYENRVVDRFDAFRLKKDGKIVTEDISTPDGVKKHVVSAEREYYKSLLRTTTYFYFEGEKLFGLGQYEDGIWNYRGKDRFIHQGNKQISLPVLISSKGYGLMFTTRSPSYFCDTQKGSFLHTEGDYYLDYFVIVPENFEGIIKRIRSLTGSASMLPKWSYSYVQSKERYETQEEILDISKEFIKRDIPLGTIVLDWMSWEEGMWGQKTFDKKRFPDVKKMIDTLHENGHHFMLSIWPSMNEATENYKEFFDNHLLLPGTNVADVFCEEGRKLYWKQTKEGLFDNGVESFWCDSSEPITPEWEVKTEPLSFEKYENFKKVSNDSLYPDKGNTYGYFHAKGIYEGQRSVSDKRVLNLTRSGYYGSHQFGVVVWSGDISASWEVFRNQIVAGLSLAMCSIAYWTLDIGAFFVKKGIEWFWNGQFEDTNKNFGYRELYTRWLQYGAFLSMFRSHGTDVSREPWNFGNKGEMFYDAIVSAIKLRESLMPYIYSTAYKVSKEDEMFIRPMFFETPNDPKAYDCKYQFMFGKSLMVVPVINPIYYDEKGTKIDNPNETMLVYFPMGDDYFDFYTGEKYEGGQYHKVKASIDRIPLFVKGNAIIPTSVGEDIIVKVFGNDDSSFELYFDEGTDYTYEKGEFETITLYYNGVDNTLSSKIVGEKKFFNGKIELSDRRL